MITCVVSILLTVIKSEGVEGNYKLISSLMTSAFILIQLKVFVCVKYIKGGQ